MKVTSVKINKFERGNIKAFADIAIENAIVIKGVKILENKDGELFIGFPSTKFTNKNGKVEYKDIVFPIDKDLRREIVVAVINKYEKVTGGESSNEPKPQNNVNNDVDDINSLPF